MIVQVLEANGIKTENKVQLGSNTKIMRGAITAGEIDIYPEYTGNGAFFFSAERIRSGRTRRRGVREGQGAGLRQEPDRLARARASEQYVGHRGAQGRRNDARIEVARRSRQVGGGRRPIPSSRLRTNSSSGPMPCLRSKPPTVSS